MTKPGRGLVFSLARSPTLGTGVYVRAETTPEGSEGVLGSTGLRKDFRIGLSAKSHEPWTYAVTHATSQGLRGFATDLRSVLRGEAEATRRDVDGLVPRVSKDVVIDLLFDVVPSISWATREEIGSPGHLRCWRPRDSPRSWRALGIVIYILPAGILRLLTVAQAERLASTLDESLQRLVAEAATRILPEVAEAL